ncbi:hypothetical protein MycrhDRAFT_4249 [Mycolicibacterium rhodesiae JS60]|nr:hypothetical protein MycrhDRAFT_4249 [Mycolicibacterium rhodesiae JS60]
MSIANDPDVRLWKQLYSEQRAARALSRAKARQEAQPQPDPLAWFPEPVQAKSAPDPALAWFD